MCLGHFHSLKFIFDWKYLTRSNNTKHFYRLGTCETLCKQTPLAFSPHCTLKRIPKKPAEENRPSLNLRNGPGLLESCITRMASSNYFLLLFYFSINLLELAYFICAKSQMTRLKKALWRPQICSIEICCSKEFRMKYWKFGQIRVTIWWFWWGKTSR